MKKRILMVCLLVIATIGSVVANAQVELKDNPPDVYRVKVGDTLWDIATMYLEDPWRWSQIWEINPQLDNPHLIYPGDALYLVYVEGQPRLCLKRGSGEIRLQPKMRVEPLDLAIPVIELEDIGAFLRGHRIITPEESNQAPYVMAGAQKHLLSSAGDRFYARGSFPPSETVFGIFRSGDTYVDPDTGELLGYQGEDIGSARLIEMHGTDVAELEVSRMTTEIRNGDRLLPNEDRIINATFHPRAPEHEVNGYMIAVDGGVSQVGSLDVVAINRGEREGIEEGQVLAIFKAGEVVNDPIRGEDVKLPDVRSGLLMLFRTFEKMSYGIVLKASRPLAIMDRVSNP